MVPIRILDKISFDPSGCWNWTAASAGRGYGVTSLNSKNFYAHRAMYILFNGELPPSIMVCHSCDNRKCVNPDHLFPGTAKENSQDAVSKGRMAKGERGGMAKLTSEDVIAIRAANGRQWEIAERYGITHSNVSAIKLRKSWRHI